MQRIVVRMSVALEYTGELELDGSLTMSQVCAQAKQKAHEQLRLSLSGQSEFEIERTDVVSVTVNQ